MAQHCGWRSKLSSSFPPHVEHYILCLSLKGDCAQQRASRGCRESGKSCSCCCSSSSGGGGSSCCCGGGGCCCGGGGVVLLLLLFWCCGGVVVVVVVLVCGWVGGCCGWVLWDHLKPSSIKGGYPYEQCRENALLGREGDFLKCSSLKGSSVFLHALLSKENNRKPAVNTRENPP